MPTVMITGAKRGIGRGLTDRFLEAGWEVVAAGRGASETPLADMNGVRALDIDVADEASIKVAVDALEDLPIDILINNAGVFDSDYAGLNDFTTEQWHRDFVINTMGPVLVTRAFMPNLELGVRKQVAVVSSTMGSMGDNTSGSHYVYRSTKAAVNAAWVSMARDLEPEGFTCVALCPGWVRTDMGGPSAALSIEESTTGLFNVLNNLTPEQNGQFINRTGAIVPW